MIQERVRRAWQQAVSHFPSKDAIGHGSKRTALLRLAVVSSSVSKAFGLALQAIAIPLVYRSLGQHKYQLYLLISAALATIAIGQMGAGPGLTQSLARANATGTRSEESALFHAAFRLTVSSALIGAVIVLGVLHFVAPAVLFGPPFAGERAAILGIANVCVFVVIAQIVSGVVDSALAGYQEQVFTNIGSVASNLVTIAMLILVCRYFPSITNVILVLYGLPTLSRVTNLVGLLHRRSYLMHGIFQSARGRYAALLNVGLAFWAMQIGSLVEQHGGTYVLSHLSSTQETNLFAIVYKTLSLVGSVNIVVTQPLWPAFTDAIARRDFDWIERAYGRIRRALTVFSCAVAAIMASVGPLAFHVFVRVDTDGSRELFVVLGVYFVANVWTHLYYVTMMGMPGIWRIAAVAFCENVLLLVFALLLVPRYGGLGMGLAYLTASLVLPVWLLPRLMKKTMREIAAPKSLARQPGS